jgi:predicted nucleotidyltransferase
MTNILLNVQKIAEMLNKELASDLTSVHIYGSVARGEYHPRRSNLNLLLILQQLGREILRQISLLQAKLAPLTLLLCLTEEYLKTSLDTFPLELLDLKLHHKTLSGSDILSEMEISPHYLRIQLERELKSKLILLRQNLFLRGCQEKELCALMVSHLPALDAILQGLLFLCCQEDTGTRLELYDLSSRKLNFSRTLFPDILSLKLKNRVVSGAKPESLYFDLMDTVGYFSQLADKFSAGANPQASAI